MLTKLDWEDDEVQQELSVIKMFEELRLAEARRTQRKLRSRKKVEGKIQQVVVSESSELQQLRTRITQLEEVQDQVSMTEECGGSELVQLHQRMAILEKKFVKTGRMVMFCYRCGEDLHRASECTNPGNQEKVREKLEQRRKGKTEN